MAFTNAMHEVLCDNNRPVLENEDIFGWVNYDAVNHIRNGCRWVLPAEAKVRSIDVDEFADTLIGNRTLNTVECAGASCTCGAYKNVTLRYEGTIQDLVHDLLDTDL